MITIAAAVIAIATLVICCWLAYWVGYTRHLRTDEGFRFGKAEGYRIGIVEGEGERDDLRYRLGVAVDERDECARAVDELREELNEAKDTLDATMLRFEEYVEDHANTFPPTIWSDAVPPGGQVCAVPMSGRPGEICGMPVESEPCPEHVCACFRTVDAAYEEARALSDASGSGR